MNNTLRKNNNCVIWTRVSTAKQEQNGGSLDYQKQLCEKYAKEHKLKVVGYYGGTHESAKQIGKLCREMINTVKKDTSISYIICSKLDRLSRKRGDAINLMDDLRELGVSIVEASTGQLTSSIVEAFVAALKFNSATLDNEIRKETFYNGRKHCYQSGAYTGVLPIGYTRTNPKTGEKTQSLKSYCFLNDEGKKIQFAFHWKLQGMTNSQILEKLDTMGLHITKQTLNHIFNNPFYAGKIKSVMLEDGMIDGKIEKAVSYTDWLKVQKIMSDKSGKYKHKKQVEDAPLKGYVLCSVCGKPLTAYKQKGHWYYKCNTNGCKFNMSAEKLHSMYHQLLQSLELPQGLCEQYQDMIKQMLKDGNEQSLKQATVLKKQRTETKKKLEKCKTRFALEEIDEDIYKSAVSTLEEELHKINEQLEGYEEILSNYQSKVDDITLICSNTSNWWINADLATRKRIQKLTFPSGIQFDREEGNYRTLNRNRVYDIIDEISDFYKNKKGESSIENSPLVKLCAG